MDQDPPSVGADPTDFPFATECTHLSGGAGNTYDPLGQRFLVGMTMDF